MYRVSFDPALPVVAASPFTAAGQSFASGDPVNWRALGVDEATLFQWWQASLVVHPLTGGCVSVETPDPADLTDDELERLTRPE